MDIQQGSLEQAVDEVLHYIWDPIGIAAEPGARDEYRSYVPAVTSILRRGDDYHQVCSYLRNLSMRIQRTPSSERSHRAATALICWRHWRE